MLTTLHHFHVTFTIPGKLSRLLFSRGYDPIKMISLCSNIYRSYLVKSLKLKGKEYQPGILATLHKSGNSLNYNPHVHLIGTREVVDTKTGEIIDSDYMPYGKIRYLWQKAFLKHLIKQGALSENEAELFKGMYKKGFHPAPLCLNKQSGAGFMCTFKR